MSSTELNLYLVPPFPLFCLFSFLLLLHFPITFIQQLPAVSIFTTIPSHCSKPRTGYCDKIKNKGRKTDNLQSEIWRDLSWLRPEGGKEMMKREKIRDGKRMTHGVWGRTHSLTDDHTARGYGGYNRGWLVYQPASHSNDQTASQSISPKTLK